MTKLIFVVIIISVLVAFLSGWLTPLVGYLTQFITIAGSAIGKIIQFLAAVIRVISADSVIMLIVAMFFGIYVLVLVIDFLKG